MHRLVLHCLPFSSIILRNTQSLRNKVDELQVIVNARTETWLRDHDLSQDFEIDGFGDNMGQ